MAKCNGVSPSLSLTLRLTFTSFCNNNNFTISSLFTFMAKCNGDTPFLFSILILPPFSNNNSIISLF
jgi:hypothetical protein